MATLPLLPERDKEYTVVEYPSNRQVIELAKVMLHSEGLPENRKREIADRYNIDEAEISNDLSPQEQDLRTAEIVFEEELPRSVEWEDLSSKAVSEAMQVFMGIAAGTNSGRRTF